MYEDVVSTVPYKQLYVSYFSNKQGRDESVTSTRSSNCSSIRMIHRLQEISRITCELRQVWFKFDIFVHILVKGCFVYVWMYRVIGRTKQAPHRLVQ